MCCVAPQKEWQGELTRKPCALRASQVLGYGIVVGSAGVKMPQIYKIMKADGELGLSGTTLLIEWASSVATLSYYLPLGYPFSTWGENFFLFFQNGIITGLYLKHTSGIRSAKFALVALLSAMLGSVLYLRSLPDIVLPEQLCSATGMARCRISCEELAVGLPFVLMLFGRLPQILQNQRQGHTGALSLITYLLNVLGGAARVFTVMQEIDNKGVLLNVCSGFVQNTVILAQILLLGAGGKPKKTD